MELRKSWKVCKEGGFLSPGRARASGPPQRSAFARSGARVAIHYNHSDREAQDVADRIAKRGGAAILVRGDVTVRGEAKTTERSVPKELLRRAEEST